MSDNVTREPYRNAWYKQLQKAIEEAEPRLVPEYKAEDAGKVLTINSEGVPSWEEAPKGNGFINEALYSNMNVSEVTI